MKWRKVFSPLTWPILSFAAVITVGSMLLWMPAAWAPGKSVSWLDALFTATSGVCVTGLSVVDVGSTFSGFGQCVLLALIQLGGLGITMYTSLVFILWRNRVPFNDQLAVRQALLNKNMLDLRAFVRRVVGLVLLVEGVAALLLWLHDPVGFAPFSAVFHAVSAFCNAGFGLLPDNLVAYRSDAVVNAVIGLSIVCGGLGFVVLYELGTLGTARVRRLWHWVRHMPRTTQARTREYPVLRRSAAPWRKTHSLDRYSRMVIHTTLWLVFGGGFCIFLIEVPRIGQNAPDGAHYTLFLQSLFQSISARTAGFNSIDLTTFTGASLLTLIVLMFIGGSPGSCAGGIKTTTFRVLLAFIKAQFSGDRQIVVEQRAVTQDDLSRAMTLFFFTVLTISVSTALLSLTENGLVSASEAGNVPLLYLLFEVVSAIGTVGLSLNLTPNLSDGGKVIIILNMFVGRVGLLALLLALQSLRPVRPYNYPHRDIAVG